MIYEVQSDGDIDTRPVHLRSLCHIKHFQDKQNADLKDKLDTIEIVVNETIQELEEDI